jgi:hypothetical protein
MHPATTMILLPWLVGLGAMVLMVAALLSLGRADGTQRELVTWLAVIVLAPVLGPVLWFVLGKDQRSRSPH